MATMTEPKKYKRSWRRGKRMLAVSYSYLFLAVAMGAAFYFGASHEDTSLEHQNRRLLSEERSLATDADGLAVPAPAPTNSSSSKSLDLMGIDLFTMEQRKGGAIVLHIWCILIMFYGIAVLCDNYFEPALEKICDHFGLEEDVAGATFMAAGGSAPELATSLLGVFVTKSDIGIGTIVGSAVFNVLFVIGVCAILAPNLDLTWWPLARDCTYYCFSILVLTICILDQKIDWYEAVLLLGLYVIYVLIMANNQRLHKKVAYHIDHHDLGNRPKICQVVAKIMDTNLVEMFIYAVIILNLVVTVGYPDEPIPDFINLVCALIYILEFLIKNFGLGFVGYWLDPMNALDGVLVVLIIVELIISSGGDIGGAARSVRSARLFRFFRVIRVLRMIRLYKAFYTPKQDAYTQTTPRLQAGTAEEQFAEPVVVVGSTEFSSAAVEPTTNTAGGAKVVPANDDETPADEKKEGEGEGGGEEGEDDDDDDGPYDPFEVPDSMIEKFIWFTSMPMIICMYMVIPDCNRPGRENWWPLSFVGCITTIAILAYVMVWMATLFGKVANIPDPVMGLTFLAAGTSIPDALSSLAVARKGFGDMAVSSSVGSNIFDILIGLPVPWILQTGIVDPGGTVDIASSGIAIMIITLFIMVALVVVSIQAFNWRLVKKLGYIYIALYILFVIESLMLEYDVFL